ncbi:MAG: PD-(D/E)XK nuclease family protein, partial [bacterium]|nr:PD-(D/E)XK nuclease family protein [bacterium]
GHQKLWEIRKAEIHATLDRFVGKEKDYFEAAREVPAHFEASFGMIPRQQSDPLSTAEPLIIDSASAPIGLMGKVDRIDVSGGDAGRRHFSVLDYKTGKHAPSSNAIVQGESLQLPLYTAWAKGALGADYGLHKASFYLLKSGEKKCQIPTRDTSWEDAWGLARQFIQDYVESIRGGMFPMGEKKCSPYCRYGAVCRIGEE